MKKIFFILLITQLNAAVDLSQWQWQRSIELGASSAFVRFSITPEIFDQCQAALHDLRLIDEDKSFVPHLIYWGREHETSPLEWQSARLINGSFAPGQYVRVVADFNQPLEKNQIAVDLSGTNYRRRAVLEGGVDGQAWEMIVDDILLFGVRLTDYSFNVNRITFPSNNFRYLRLTVYHMPDDQKRITVNSISAGYQQNRVEKAQVVVAVNRMSARQDTTLKRTLVELDLGFRNLPVSSIQFSITTPFFHRGYEVFGRNEIKIQQHGNGLEQDVPWRQLDSGVMYRIQNKQRISEAMKVENLWAPFRYLKIVVFNGDNPPLDIERVTVLRRDVSLIFQAKPEHTFILLGGNPTAAEPDYDLARSFPGMDYSALPIITLGPLSAIPHQEPFLPWTERHGTLLLVILVMAVCGMVVLIIRNFSKISS